jgi:thioredoxin-dependent peroxiredoxin
VGVSCDPTSANRAFREKFFFPYDLLSDEDKSMSVAYGAAQADSPRASRISVLVDPNGKVAKVYGTVKPADHPDEVLADLARLG